MELKKRTNLDKFGAEWAIQTDEAKAKRVATNREKFGADHHLQTDESLAKLRATNLERYGVEYPGQSEESKAAARATNLERYGVENPFQSEEAKAKIRATTEERYGVPNAMQSDEVKAKVKATNLERYGVANPFQADTVQEKIRKTNLDRLGVAYPAQAPEVKAKIRATNIERYGVGVPFQSEAVKAKSKETLLATLGVEFPSQSPEVRAKGRKTLAKNLSEGMLSGRGRISKLNRDFAASLEARFGLTTRLEVAAGDCSFDLGIEGTNLVIELNPTVTHNADVALACLLESCALPCVSHKPLPADYHYRRALVARDHGLRLLQFYGWDTNEAALNLLAGKLEPGFTKLSARKLSLRTLSSTEANKFLGAAHFQGGVRGQKFCYGLTNGEELIAVATFGAARFGAKADYEFLRYAVKSGFIVHGGAHRLFKAFLADANPTSVVSYISFDHTTSPAFLGSIGFRELSPTGPSLVWHNPKTNKRVTHTSLLAQGADRLLGTSYGSREESGLDNEAIMGLEGYLRVFTAGNRSFRWDAEPEV